MFPIADMPRIIQWITILNPVPYFLVMWCGLSLQGVGLSIFRPQRQALLVTGITTLWRAISDNYIDRVTKLGSW